MLLFRSTEGRCGRQKKSLVGLLCVIEGMMLLVMAAIWIGDSDEERNRPASLRLRFSHKDHSRYGERILLGLSSV